MVVFPATSFKNARLGRSLGLLLVDHLIACQPSSSPQFDSSSSLLIGHPDKPRSPHPPLPSGSLQETATPSPLADSNFFSSSSSPRPSLLSLFSTASSSQPREPTPSLYSLSRQHRLLHHRPPLHPPRSLHFHHPPKNLAAADNSSIHRRRHLPQPPALLPRQPPDQKKKTQNSTATG
uniref:Uncharacterized protein n=1 Tax=Populus alba TaxID=43335 RepID=A0A4U5P664_POPAL|nr:hypothetical protein D5086_0000220300 [Populus alba]